MKKIITVLVTCVIILLLTYYLWSNPNLVKDMLEPVSNIIESFTLEKELPYTQDFMVNEITIKTTNYYYNKLLPNEQAIYKSLANAIKELKTDFIIQDYEFFNNDQTMKDVEKALNSFLLDHPEVFYLNDKYAVSTNKNIFGTKIGLNISYTVTSKEELNNQIEQIKVGMQEILSKVNISENDFEKELKLHDVLGKVVKYYEYDDINQIPHSAHTIYGTFVQKSAVCDGLSKSMQVLLDNVGIESIVLTGRLNNEAHAWNMVNLENDWYNLDITSDKSIKDYSSVVIHSYFNITTEKIKQTHSIDYEEIIPIAISKKYDYFVYKDKLITINDNFNTKLIDILNSNSDSEKVEYTVENVDNVPEKTINVLRRGRYYQYLDESLSRFVYYNVLDNYIIIKK